MLTEDENACFMCVCTVRKEVRIVAPLLCMPCSLTVFVGYLHWCKKEKLLLGQQRPDNRRDRSTDEWLICCLSTNSISHFE
ncbi:uncharacterized protein LOC119324436 [Triticum dicoccoides]|uniref:uncharacterized protein LOC119324436 n=1 Tax=Triticum dicoccoides TaxID=85692 RepID=UPI00189112C1|nr:uncharacterized protein LOC119324436 [Triticum dicoccoides]